MTLSMDRLAVHVHPEIEGENVNRGQQLFDIAQTALIGFRESGVLPEGITAIYGSEVDELSEKIRYPTQGLHVVSKLGTVSVETVGSGPVVRFIPYEGHKETYPL